MHKILMASCIILIVGFQYIINVEGADSYIRGEKTEGSDDLMGEEQRPGEREGDDTYKSSEPAEGSEEFAGEQQPEKEKSELALLMQEIDESYKTVEEMSGYYQYKKKQWKIIREAGEIIEKVTKKVRIKFAKPDDWTYEELMEMMQNEAAKMVAVAKNHEREGALEEQQWQVRRLRQTCAKCHKHLDIHIYPNLYKKDHAEAPPEP